MTLRTGWHWLARMYWQLPASPAGVVHWDPRRRVPAFFLLVSGSGVGGAREPSRLVRVFTLLLRSPPPPPNSMDTPSPLPEPKLGRLLLLLPLMLLLLLPLLPPKLKPLLPAPVLGLEAGLPLLLLPKLKPLLPGL